MLSVRINKELDSKMEAYAKAKGVKYMRGRILVELAEMMLEIIYDESKEYKTKIENMIKTHKEEKLEKALRLVEAMDEEGLEFKEKRGSSET